MTQHYTSTENALDAADRTLWLSVIEQAVRDARSGAATADRIDARRWLTSDTIDLRLVCAYAGVDPAYLLRRARLLAACDRWFDAGPRESRGIANSAVPWPDDLAVRARSITPELTDEPDAAGFGCAA